MPYIKMLTSVAGRVGGHETPAFGSVLAVDDAVAEAWADGSRATLVDAHGDPLQPNAVEDDDDPDAVYIKLLVSVGGSIGDHDAPSPGAVLKVDRKTADIWADGVRAVETDQLGNELPSDDDVPEKAAAVVEWIGDDRDRAEAALEVEQARDKPRKTVTDHIKTVLAT